MNDSESKGRRTEAGPVRRVLMIIVGIAALAYVGLCVLLLVEQRSLIYFPQPRGYLDGVTLLTLNLDGQSVLVSTRPHDGDEALIYFGGNAEDVSLDMPAFSQEFPDAAIYLLHYPGFGGSSGKPSEKAIVADALALFDSVHALHSRVVVVGRSLGSGVAIQVASQRPVARLVLVTPYDGLEDIAAQEYPFLPVRLLLQDKFESWRYAPKVSAPTLILAASEDEVVPRSSTERLRSRFSVGVVRFVEIPGTGHNTISESPGYMDLIRGG